MSSGSGSRRGTSSSSSVSEPCSSIGEEDETEGAGRQYRSSAALNDDYFEKFVEHGGWKSLLLYQFQPQVSVAIILSVCMSYAISLKYAAFALGTKEEKIPKTYALTTVSLLYAFDMFYFLDLISMVIYRSVNWTDVQYIYQVRHGFIIFIEFMTVIPFDGIYYSLAKHSLRVVFLLRLRYALRIVRLLSYFNLTKTYIGRNSGKLHLLVVLLIIFVTINALAAVVYVAKCSTLKDMCEYGDEIMYSRMLFSSANKMTNMGSDTTDTQYNIIYFGMIGYITYVFNNYLLSFFICDVIQLIQEKFALIRHYEHLERTIMKFNLISADWQRFHGKFLAIIRDVYHLIWMNKRGLDPSKILGRKLPEIMFKELQLDMFWVALKHTHVFRNEDCHYLRLLSTLMVQKFMMPGEILYKKNEFKSKMVYVVSGVVEILSEEDNETPIIAFSEGTVLGESTLLIDYPSISSAIAKSYCEVAVLEKKKFVTVWKLYPEKLRSALQRIRERYTYSKQFTRLSQYQLKSLYETERLEELTMRWLKYILRDLLDIRVVIDNKSMLSKLDRLVFCTKYLDLLVIAKEVELVTDTVFLKSTFPYILQPGCILVATWDKIVFVSLLVFGLLYVYFVSVAYAISDAYMAFHVIISIIWILDVWMQASTAVRTRNEFYTTITDIVLHRLDSVYFIVDLFAAIPTGLVLYAMHGNINRRDWLLIESNRLFKFYKIKVFMDSIRSTSSSKLVLIKFYTFVIYLALLCYYMAGMFHIMACYDDNCPLYKLHLKKHQFTTPIRILMMGFYSSVKFFCNYERNKFHAYFTYNGLFLMQAIFFVCNIYFLAYCSACKMLNKMDTHEINEYCRSFSVAMQNMEIGLDFQEYTWQHIRAEFQYDNVNFLYGNSIYNFLPEDLQVIVRQIGLGHVIRSVPLFSNLDRHVIGCFSAKVRTHVLPKYSVIVFQGEVCKEMHVIAYGWCILYSGGECKIVGPGDSFSVLETCLQIPVLNTVVTLCNCMIVSLSYKHYISIIIKFPELHQQIKSALDDFQRSAQLRELQAGIDCGPEITYVKEKDRNVHRFSYCRAPKVETSKESEHKILKSVMLCRYLLMPFTFTPYGKFMLCWESVRCLFTFLTCMLIPIPQVGSCEDCVWFYVLAFLDVTAWVDIYLRHHICYFDSRGIEVSHPMYTALNYWKHSFLIDLFASFPIGIITRFIYDDVRLNIFWRLNRFVQSYRLFGFINYMCTLDMSLSVFEIYKHIPMIVLITNGLSSIMFNYFCTYVQGEYFTCVAGTWIANVTVGVKLDNETLAAHTYIYCLYFTTTLFSNVFYPFLLTPKIDEKLYLIIVTLVGYFFWVSVAANVVALVISKNFDLSSYQVSLKKLIKFMGYRRIDKRLKKEVIYHFEYMWYKRKGKRIEGHLNVYSTGFQENILHNVFGKNMSESSVFAKISESIVRSLLLDARHEIILKRGIVYRVNDVIGKIFFLHKGKVEVLGPDGNHLQFLHSGSLFGNLDNFPRSRQTVTVIANGHVELLVFSSVKFHAVLSKYPKARRSFMRQTSINVDYLRNTFTASDKRSALFSADSETVFDHTIAIRLWKPAVVVLSFLSFVLEMYHLGTLDYAVALTVALYSLDLAFVVKVILKFYTAYEDEFGLLVRSRAMIANRYYRQVYGFYFDLFSVFPMEICCLAFINTANFMPVWVYLRWNRLVRIVSVVKYVQYRTQKLNINVFCIRLVYLFLVILIVLVTLGSIFCHMDLTVNHLFNMSSTEKFIFYMKRLSYMISIAIKATVHYDLKFVNIKFAMYTYISTIICRYLSIYFVAEMISTVQIINRNKLLFQSFVINMRTYMSNEKISVPLAKRIGRYMNSLYVYHKGYQFPALLDEAPYYLREAILNSMFGLYVRKHPMLKMCHVDLIRQISARLQTRIFFYGDFITYVGDIDHCMYFIHDGEVQALSEDTVFSEVVNFTLYSGEMFGFEQGMYLKSGHENTYKVTKNSTILVLHRSDWIYLLDYYPASKSLIYDKRKDV